MKLDIGSEYRMVLKEMDIGILFIVRDLYKKKYYEKLYDKKDIKTIELVEYCKMILNDVYMDVEMLLYDNYANIRFKVGDENLFYIAEYELTGF